MVLFFPSDLPSCLLFVLQLWAPNWWLTCWYETSWGRSRTPCCWMFRTWPNTRTWSEQSEPIVWECLLWDEDGPSRQIFQFYRKDYPNQDDTDLETEHVMVSVLKFVLLTFESAHYPVWSPESETRPVLPLTSNELEACSQTNQTEGAVCVILCVISSSLKAGLRPLTVHSDLGGFTSWCWPHSGLTAKIFHICFFLLFFDLKKVKEAAECWRKCINLYANKGL